MFFKRRCVSALDASGVLRGETREAPSDQKDHCLKYMYINK